MQSNWFVVRTAENNGRLCNQIIRNLATSLIAEAHDLYIEYSNHEKIHHQLGIVLFVGKDVHQYTVILTDDSYFNVLENTAMRQNVNPNQHYFQTKKISNLLYNHIRTNLKSNIMHKNPYKCRYNSNRDIFVHIRLGDVQQFNPGVNYYLHILQQIIDSGTVINTIYLATDSPHHEIIQQIFDIYPKLVKLYIHEEIDTIQFGSTCSNLILSHGSFSVVIGYLAFYSTIYYPAYTNNMWFGDIFSIPGWNKV